MKSNEIRLINTFKLHFVVTVRQSESFCEQTIEKLVQKIKLLGQVSNLKNQNRVSQSLKNNHEIL